MHETEQERLSRVGERTLQLFSDFVQFQNTKYALMGKLRWVDFTEHRSALAPFLDTVAELAGNCRHASATPPPDGVGSEYWTVLGNYLADLTDLISTYARLTDLQDANQGLKALLCLRSLISTSRAYHAKMRRCATSWDELKFLWWADKIGQQEGGHYSPPAVRLAQPTP